MRWERGYTLIETLLAIAITGFLAAVAGLAVSQIVTVPERGDDQVEALHAVQNAAHWVALDGQMASSANGGGSLTLALPDSSVISYVLYGTDLHRIYGSSNRTVAENIASVNFTVQDRIINMSIIAAPDSRWDISENQTYQIYMRPTG